MKPKVLIVVPAFNEEETIEPVLNDLNTECPDFDILVVNDSSKDNTSQIAKSTCLAQVID